MRCFFIFLFCSQIVLSQQNVFLPQKQVQNYYIETNSWFDGTSMNDSKADGFIYMKKGSGFYVLSDYLNGNIINAKIFGVKADGKTDDTASLQIAFDLSVKYGITLILPYGEMRTSGNLLLDLSNSKGKTRVVGSGISNTVIKNFGDKTQYALKITGNYFNNLELRDFRIERDLSSPEPTGNIGLAIEKQVYASLENIEVIRFKTGVEMTDVSTLYMKGINARFCGKGFYFSRGSGGVSNPNLIEMHSCVLTSNSDWGITIVNGHSVNIYSSLFEDNKLGGINFSYDGTNGANSINLQGSYFEGNRGADFYLRSTASGSHNLIGNTFNRVSKEKFTNNNIVFDFATKNNETNIVTMMGNGILNANDYITDKGRTAVKIISPNSSVKIFDTNSYKSEEDKPNYSGKNIQIINN